MSFHFPPQFPLHSTSFFFSNPLPSNTSWRVTQRWTRLLVVMRNCLSAQTFICDLVIGVLPWYKFSVPRYDRMCRLVSSVFLYARESRTLTAELQRRIQTMEMRCYHKILRISYKDHVNNEKVRAKIKQAIGPHEDLIIGKRRKLQWYGQVSRSIGLAKTILQGTVKEGRRQSTQGKRWEDIREWTGLEFAKSQRAVENREKWRKLVVKSSVVPQRLL